MAVLCGRTLLPTLYPNHRCFFFPFHLKTLNFTTTTTTTTCKASSLSSNQNPSPPTPTCKASSLSSNQNPSPPTPTYETLSPHQRNQISLFVGALLQWNQRMNLTAVTEESEVMARHVEDSLAMLAPLQQSYLDHCGGSASCDGLNLVDVGSGAGLPGLILAVARPNWKFTLLESMQKRCLFLEHVAELTGLSNVNIVRERAEDRTPAKVSTSGRSTM